MSSIAAHSNSAPNMSSSRGWVRGQPHGGTVAGEALPPDPPAQFIEKLRRQYKLTAVPVLMQSAIKTREHDLHSYLQKLRRRVLWVRFDRLLPMLPGAIRAYYRLPSMDATTSGQTEALGLKIAVGLGTRVLQVPNASQQAYATSCLTVAGGNLREYRLSHLPTFPRFVDQRLLPNIYGLVIWVLQPLAPASYSFSDVEMRTGKVSAGTYDFIGFVAAFFKVSPAAAYERMFPNSSAGKVSFYMRYLYFR